MNLKKNLCGLLAGICLAAQCSAFSAGAAVVQTPIGYRGDINADDAVTMSDVLLLARYLINEDAAAVPADRAQFADMDADNRLNVFDLARMTRVVGGYAEAEMIYIETEVEEPQPEEALMDAPVSAVNPTVLSKGTNHLLMFVVEFPDCKFRESYTAEQIKALSFGAEDTGSPYYPLESVIGYYERSSYGALEMDADVFTYTAANSISTYTNHTDALVEEIMTAFDQQLDYNNYDVNSDGTMDTILLSVADNAPDDGWWPCSGGYYGYQTFDGVRAGNVILGNTSPADTAVYNNTWIHELGHAMGLPDYYKYENTEDGWFGLNGAAGTEMMDDAYGDMCAFSKLMYGWYTPSQVQVYTGGTQTFTLESSQTAANCILIPRGELNGYLSEYMMLEYATDEGNNAGLVGRGGIRVLHCEATITEGYWGPEFKWNNYGMNYDSSNTRQRVLRLANESEGGDFFVSGSVINNDVSGFRWYDDSGYQTVDTGVTITVGELTDGRYTVTISQ